MMAPEVQVAAETSGSVGFWRTVLTKPVLSWALYDLANTLFSMNIVGFGIGPILVGGLSRLFGGELALRYALVSCVMLLPWAAFHYALAARTYRTDLEAKNVA